MKFHQNITVEVRFQAQSQGWGQGQGRVGIRVELHPNVFRWNSMKLCWVSWRLACSRLYRFCAM